MRDLLDDLPADLQEEIRLLDQELEDGDITQKGYDKKKNALLKPYLDQLNTNTTEEQKQENEKQPVIVTRTYRPTEGEYYHQPPRPLAVDDDEEDNYNENNENNIDLGPEPSAADTVDFLDFLPSPTHSPPRSTSPETFMENNHQQIQEQQQQQHFLQQQQQQQIPIANQSPRQQHQQPIPQWASAQPQTNYRPYSSQSQSQQPQQWNQPYGVPVRPRPFDPRMMNRPQYGAPPPPPPGHNYPLQRPPLPHHINGNVNPMYRPQPPYSSVGRPTSGPPPPPPPNSNSMYSNVPHPRPPYYRPTPPQHAATQNVSSNHIRPASPSHHSRTASMDSSTLSHERSQIIRQSSEYTDQPTEPISPNGTRRSDIDWETASMSGWRSNNTGRAPSIMSSSTTRKTLPTPISNIRRAEYMNRGRSRYGDSYMATSFKAIEPAPISLLRLDDPHEQMLLADLAGRQMRPLQSRTIPFSVMDDGNGQQQHNLEEFQNIAAILRYRATSDNHRLASAFTVLDSKGKEPASLSWEKLNARAEKIAVQFRDKKSGIQSGDRVALIYRKSEVLEFIVALFGCFLAGVVAIPINAADDLSELSFILNLTNANLILTTEFNHRAFIKDIQTRSLDFPANIDWWKTDSFGTWYPSKKAKEYASIKAVELAYIEYAKAVNGELKGVIVTHHSIMEEGRMYKAGITDTTVSINQNDQTLDVQPKRQQYSGFDTVVTYLEPRQQVGLVLSVLCSVYSGNHTVFTSGSIVDTPATWIYVISKYKATIALADYPALNNITQYYQNNAKEVRNHSKKVAPDLSSLRYLFIDSSISKPDLNNFIAEKLLRPLGNNDNPMKVVCPILSLPEHGGMILSFRDNLGPAQLETFGQDQDHRSVFAEGNSNDIWECLLDAEALKSNKVVLVAAGEGARTARTDSHETLVSSFGFVIPDATVAIVDPDTTTLCPPDTLGEVWIDAPSISGGFWSLPRHSEAIFHAKPTIIPPDTMYPEIYNQEFLRTGLVGTLIGGRLVTFGNYEDRIRQQRFGDVHGSEEIFFATDIIDTIETRVKNDKCTVFDITINDQHLPIVACESNAPRTELPALTLEIEESLLELHGLRPFAIFVVAVNGLPRQLKHGRRQIHSLMTKRSFLNGQLTIRSLRMDVDRTIFNVASNDESVVSVWHSGITYERALRQRVIIPFQQQQHTGMETIRSVIDERTEYDLSKFTNIIDILQWRTAVHPEETAFVGLSHNGSGSVETKPYSWRKINYTIASVATYLNKRGFKRGHKALLVIPFSVDWILAIYACLAIGVTPIPMEVPDPQQQQVQRIKDDVEAILTTARDLNVTYVIVNNHSENILKNKPVNPPMRQLLTSTFKGYKLPEYTNINKASKHHKLLGKESGISFRPEWLIGEYSISPLIISQVSTNGKRYYTALRHETIINQCRVQKTTCQLKSQRGIVATGLGACDSIGLLHSTFCGVYIGCITVMVPTEEYYLNPFSFFEMIQRYKAKDICVTLPLMQYAMNRMGPNNEQRRLNLRTTVQNIMLTTEGRPRPLFYQHLARFFTLHRLEKEALNTVYSHFTNPMITTRSYMLVEPIVLIADQYWLRRGIIRSLPVEEESRGIVLTDSGIVPSNTMVAIVNPETHALCPSNVVGEIWVSSDCNADHLLNCGNDNGASILEASLPGADPRIKYVRTGDLGFLWNVQRRGNPMEPTLEEGQCLYVLGPKWEVLERNGLMHFPGDVEATIERCHPAIPAGGSVVIQVDKEIIALVTVKSKEFATSATPLIVSSVVENHSFLIDTVIILLPNNLPRSRYGEKQRDKALTAYAEKKLNTIFVKRITNQHEPLHLQWEQSQYSNDNADNASLYTSTTRPMSTRASSIAETTHDFDIKSNIPTPNDESLTRSNTLNSHQDTPSPSTPTTST